MLKTIPDPKFVHDVSLTVPGKKDPVKVSVTWRHKTQDEYKAWIASASDFAKDGGGGDVGFLGLVMCDWSGFDHPYSQTALADVLQNYHAAGREFLDAYRTGLVESRAKN